MSDMPINYTYDSATGNLASNAGVTYTYGSSSHKHAVTSTSGGGSYSYDANGNQTSRTVGSQTYTLLYDAENRLVQVKRGNNVQATYSYDGDGNRVKAVVGSTTTTYIGSYLEWTGSTATMRLYYYAGGQRVALRQGSSTLYFLLGDHLGSTAVTATSNGGWYSELRYYPWGGTRYEAGTTPTSYRYTGQREAEVGLYYYGARFYDPLLGRFVQADTIIPSPGQSIAWDRYAYVANNPVKYIDPSGHHYCDSVYADPEECSGINHRTIEEIILWEMYRNPLHGDDCDYRNFGEYRGIDPYNNLPRWHTSIDAGHSGNFGDPVYPVLPGRVVDVGWAGSFGNYIVIRHTIGANNYYSVYAHLGTTRGDGVSVDRGQWVDQDTQIGSLGNSTTGTIDQPRPPGGVDGGMDYHLHFEISYESNVNLSGGSYLYGMRYWAFDANWVSDFFDLGKLYGYDTSNLPGFEFPR